MCVCVCVCVFVCVILVFINLYFKFRCQETKKTPLKKTENTIKIQSNIR